MSKLISKTFSLREEMALKLSNVQDAKSFNTQSAALQYCISETWDRMMRNEKRAYKASDSDDKVSIEEQRAKREEDKCRSIAERLEAKLTRSGDGFIAEYYVHSKLGSFRQRMPLMSLTEELVERQYPDGMQYKPKPGTPVPVGDEPPKRESLI